MDILLRDQQEELDKYQSTKAGKSLLQPLDINRDCKSAGVPTLYCPYNNWEELNILPHTLLVNVARKFIRFLNDEQRKYFEKQGIGKMPCIERDLIRVENGRALTDDTFYLILFAGPQTAEFEIGGRYEENFKRVSFTVSIYLITLFRIENLLNSILNF
jgi:hypothetical protein